MGLQIIWLYIAPVIKLLLVLFDNSTDILYWLTQTFYNDHLKNACLAFIILYPAIGCIFVIIIVIGMGGGHPFLMCFGIIFGLIFSPVVFVLSPVIFTIYKVKNPDSKETKFFEKIAAFEALFESLPQIVIQATNSTLMGKWNDIAVFSITVSCFALLYNFYSLTSAPEKPVDTVDLEFSCKSSMLIYIFIALFNLTTYSLTIAYMIIVPFDAPLLRFIIVMFLALMFMISFLEAGLYGGKYYEHRIFKPLLTFAFGPFVGSKIKSVIIYYNFCSLFNGLIPIIIIEIVNNEATQNWGGLNLAVVIFSCIAVFTQCCLHPCKYFHHESYAMRV